MITFKQYILEAAKGSRWRVNYNYTDKDGVSTATGNYYVHAPDKDRARSYSTADLSKMGLKNLKIRSINSK